VVDQARAVLEDMPVHVFKIGMLGSVEITKSNRLFKKFLKAH